MTGTFACWPASVASGRVGAAAATNPAGLGSATWRGVAEAASTGTFERRQGTATLTIADLGLPRIGIAIDVAGWDIGAQTWSDMSLANGSFTVGRAGSDYMASATASSGGSAAMNPPEPRCPDRRSVNH